MFCGKCGKQNPDNAVFCDGCGAQLTQPAPQAAPQQQYTQQQYTQQNPQYAQQQYAQQDPQYAQQQYQYAQQPMTPPAPKKPFPQNILEKLPPVITNNLKKVCIIAGGALVALIALIVVLVSLSNNVDLEDYITITTTGYNGYGDIEYDVDADTFLIEEMGVEVDNYDYNDIDDLDDLADMFSSASDSIFSAATASANLSAALDCEVTFPEGKEDGKLSNGDVVTYKFTFDQSIADMYDLDVDEVTIEHEVEGLKDAAVFNVLENISLTFDGYNGFGSAKITGEAFDKTVGNVNFTYDPEYQYVNYNGSNEGSGSMYIEFTSENYNLSNGDKITLSVSYVDATYLTEDGVILDGLTKEFTVEGLKESASYDLFSNITIKTSGINGEGKAYASATDSTVTVGSITFTTTEGENYIYYNDANSSYNYGKIYFDFSDSYDLSNGDKITATADVYEDKFASSGVILTNLSKEHTVSGLGKYAAKIADIKSDSLTKLYNEFKKDLTNRLYDDWTDTVHDRWFGSYADQKIGSDMKLYKTILTTPKSTTNSTKNTLYLVISVTLKDDSMDADTMYYFYYKVNNAPVDTEGNLSLGDDYSVSKSSGYTSYEDIYDSIESFSLNIEESK